MEGQEAEGIEETLARANRMFVQKAAQRFFSPTVATRYQLQQMNDGSWVLALGSTGVVQLEDAPPEPVADVVSAYSISDNFLRALKGSIDTLLGPANG